MHTWVNDIFTGLLTETTITKINNNFDEYKSIPLTKLGLDSLATMGIVLNMESQFNKEINYETFNIEDIETLEKVEHFLNS